MTRLTVQQSMPLEELSRFLRIDRLCVTEASQHDCSALISSNSLFMSLQSRSETAWQRSAAVAMPFSSLLPCSQIDHQFVRDARHLF
jgi:hypothetical protein